MFKKNYECKLIWDKLVGIAKSKERISYGVLADVLNSKHPNLNLDARYLGQVYLAPIKKFCEDNKLPPLANLVVRRDTAEPGSGAAPYVPLEDIWNFDWSKIENPFG